MKKTICLLLGIILIISALSFTGCKKNNEPEKTGKVRKNSSFVTSGGESAEAFSGALKTWGIDLDADDFQKLKGATLKSTVSFDELTWNGEEYLKDGKFDISIDSRSDFGASKTDLGIKLGYAGEETEISGGIADNILFLGDENESVSFPTLSGELLSDNLAGTNAISLFFESEEIKEVFDDCLDGIITKDDITENNDSFTANDEDFNNIDKRSVTLEGEKLTKLAEGMKKAGIKNFSKVLDLAGTEDLIKNGSKLTVTRWFDGDDFIKETVTINTIRITRYKITGYDPKDGNSIITPIDDDGNPTTEATEKVMISDSQGHSDENAKSESSDKTTAASSSTTTATTGTGTADESVTTAPTTDHESLIGEIINKKSTAEYELTDFHINNDSQAVALKTLSISSSDYEDGQKSSFSIYAVAKKDGSAGNIGINFKIVGAKAPFQNMALGYSVLPAVNDGKKELGLDGYLTIGVSDIGSAIAMPTSATVTVNEFNNKKFDVDAKLDFNGYGLYTFKSTISMKGEFGKQKVESKKRKDSTSVNDQKVREAYIGSISEKCPKIEAELRHFSDYYEKFGLLTIDKWDLYLENTDSDQYLCFMNDNTGYIDEVSKYEIKGSKLVSTDVADPEQITNYDYVDNNNGTITLGGNLYSLCEDENVKGKVYKLVGSDDLTLFLYDSGYAVFRYDINYHIVPETGELLFMYLLTKEYSTASFIINDTIAYINAEPFSVVSYGFNYIDEEPEIPAAGK